MVRIDIGSIHSIDGWKYENSSKYTMLYKIFTSQNLGILCSFTNFREGIGAVPGFACIGLERFGVRNENLLFVYPKL